MEKGGSNNNNNAPPPAGGDWKLLFDPTVKKEFQVRVHIIEARELQPRDRNGMSDPVCVVRVLNKKKNTITCQKTTICTWDHLMFFDFNLLPEEFFNGKIIVTIYDANTVLRDVEIGSYEFDVGYVWHQPGKELYRRWIGLSDKAGQFNGVQGYMKLSITILGPGDQPVPHEEEEELDEEGEGTDLQSLVLLPPSIRAETHKLELNVFRAEDLPKLDKLGKIDGFVAVKFAGNPEIKTEVIKKEFNPTWNEKLILPVQVPTMSDNIALQVRDWDAAGSDDIVSTVFLSFAEVIGQNNNNNNNNNNNRPPVDWRTPRWITLYGTPEGVNTSGPGKDAQLASKMNLGFLEGNAYRGRLLVSASSSVSPDTKLTKSAVSPMKEPDVANYVLRFDVFECSELATKKDISINVTCGNHRIEAGKTKVKNGNAQFYKSLDEMTFRMPRDKEQIPDIFINVIKHSLTNKKRLGYIRLKASSLKASAQPQWQVIETDIFNSKKKTLNDIAGFVQFRVQLGTIEELNPVKRDVVVKPKFSKYQLRSFIYQARDLPSGDDDAAADPFLVVGLGRSNCKTKTIKATCYPLWYEVLTMEVELPDDMAFAPDIHVMVWDWDTLTSNDFLGRFSVPITKVNAKFQQVPAWYPIYMKDPRNPEGEVLASFQLIPLDQVEKYNAPPNITPKFRECILEVSTIGLRGLMPYQLLPITKPLIEIDCGGPEKVVTRISSNPSGSNPNFLEVLQIPVMVPEQRLFAPSVNLKIRDDRVVRKALIATRSFSLAPYVPWNDNNNNNEEKVSIDSENMPREVNVIPGAVGLVELEEQPSAKKGKDEVAINIVPLEDPNAGLNKLTDKDPALKSARDALIKNMGKRDLPEVAESFLPGVKEEEEDDNKKRETIKKELELELQQSTFGVWNVYRAKLKKGRAIKIEVGKFKGKFRLIEKSQLAKAEPALDLLQLYKPTNYVVRVYVLEGFQLVPKDRDNKNNPYIRVALGKTKIKDIQESKQATSRPMFYKCYEVVANFPGETSLEVGVWDFNKVTKDELIGSTKIDLENRLFSNEWKNMQFKPMEFRTLWAPTSSSPQGQLKLWVDIMTPDEAKRNPPIPIAPPTPLNYELRVIIWETAEVVFKDKNMSDIFVVGYPEGQDPQTTDTHWRSEDGTGSFNWRMKFPITVPCPTPRFKIQVWDKDILNPNDAICEANLNLRPFFNKVYKDKLPSLVMDKQWVTMTHPAASGVQGKVLASFELLTLEEASRKLAGFGREDPNENPVLPKPDRPETSFNPLRMDKMLQKVLWKKHKLKVYAACACCILIILIIIISYVSIIIP